MDLTFDILLFLHLTAFAVGVTANIALPVVMSQMPRLGVEAGPAVGAIAQRLVTYGRAGFATLIVTGVAMVYLRFGSFANLGPWFMLKMALVALIVVLMGVAAFVPRDKINPRLFGLVSRLTLLAIVFAAVAAFN